MEPNYADRPQISTDIQQEVTREPEQFSFRKLGAPDMFLMFKILGKIGINELADTFSKDSVKDLLSSFIDEKQEVETMLNAASVAVGLEAVNIILMNLPKCEHEIYQMLSNVSGESIDDIKADAVRFTEMIVAFVKKEEFKDFIGVVSKLFK